MSDVVDLNEFRQKKLSAQFDAEQQKRADENKKRKQKQILRERRENELDDSVMNHPAYLFQKNKFKDNDE
jgi:hypothetical protein